MNQTPGNIGIDENVNFMIYVSSVIHHQTLLVRANINVKSQVSIILTLKYHRTGTCNVVCR